MFFASEVLCFSCAVLGCSRRFRERSCALCGCAPSRIYVGGAARVRALRRAVRPAILYIRPVGYRLGESASITRHKDAEKIVAKSKDTKYDPKPNSDRLTHFTRPVEAWQVGTAPATWRAVDRTHSTHTRHDEGQPLNHRARHGTHRPATAHRGRHTEPTVPLASRRSTRPSGRSGPRTVAVALASLLPRPPVPPHPRQTRPRPHTAPRKSNAPRRVTKRLRLPSKKTMLHTRRWQTTSAPPHPSRPTARYLLSRMQKCPRKPSGGAELRLWSRRSSMR